MRLCSINSTMGSSPCPFLARNVANSCSLKFPCLRIVWYCFFTAVLPSRFRNPILRNQAGPPLNFQLWLGHPLNLSHPLYLPAQCRHPHWVRIQGIGVPWQMGQHEESKRYLPSHAERRRIPHCRTGPEGGSRSCI